MVSLPADDCIPCRILPILPGRWLPPPAETIEAHPRPRCDLLDPTESNLRHCPPLLTVYFGTPNMFITLWFGFVYGTNPPLGTLII
jgi:hypothetical protein